MTLGATFKPRAEGATDPSEFDKVLRSLEEMSEWIKRHQERQQQGPVGVAYGPQGWGIRYTTGGDIKPCGVSLK